jgi:hypothetical protein
LIAWFLEKNSMATNTLFATAGPIESIVEHEIRIRAYEIYRCHGSREGHELDDWLQAEYEVLIQKGISVLPPDKRFPYR